ncbi:hypothetical protein [Chelatococcus reniformis]|uniref:Uncharacterized protein n=1 Tax=Chelatococcus reniformis TaxID=1494448 RepID=A0A916XNZ3_9HYPH|nr:hypothetical protein [Chelatococcus reniformis]GGC91256.1 hypothetical protein GCM10010994_56280 [Chelatococcus reniformis]
MRREGERFQQVRVDIDGVQFVNCTFDSCALIYRGGPLPMFTNCTFSNPQFAFDDAAKRTVTLLRSMATPAGGMQQIVRSTFPELFAAR